MALREAIFSNDMSQTTLLEPARSETFPFPDQFAHGVTPLGPICYFDAGTERDLPPVVLIHPLGTNFTLWEYVAPVLAQHTRVIGLDLPGCGRSAKPRHPYNLHLMSQAVLGLMNHAGLSQAVIFGHSFGGRIAADLALHHRARTAGLILMNSSGFQRYPAPVRALGQAVFRPNVIAPLIQRSIDHVFWRIFSQQNERTERFVRQVVDRRDPRYAWEFAHYACPMIKDLMSDVLDRLHELTLPMLVIWGDQDRLLRYAGVTDWVRRLPRARLLTLRGCGHMPSVEQPEAVNTATMEFLRDVASPAGRRAGVAVERGVGNA